MRHRARELPYAFHERLTFRTTTPAGHAREVLADLHPHRPRLSNVDGNSSDRKQLAWVLFVPSPQRIAGELPEGSRSRSNDARRSVPEWLYHLCRQRGFPLVSVDHDFVDAEGSSTTLQSTLQDLIAEDSLNWSVISSGPGAEADTGASALDEDYALFRRHGGLDMRRVMIVAAGQAAESVISCCASVTGLIHPPIALCLIDPQPCGSPRANVSPAGSQSLFPPTLLLGRRGGGSQYAETVLSNIQASSPEAAVLDQLSAPGSGSSKAAAATQRYALHVLGEDDVEAIASVASEQVSAEQRTAIGLTEAFLLNWLGLSLDERPPGAAGEPQPSSRL